MRRTKEDAGQTRVAVLDAAEKLFAEKGVAGTSLEAISRAAGVTRGAFYWHFKDKPAVLAALFERRCLPQQALLTLAAEQGHDDPLGLIERAGIEVLEGFEADQGNQRLFRILTNHGEDPEIADRILEHNREAFDLMCRLAEHAQQNGELNPDFSPDEAALLLLAVMTGLLSEWLRTSPPFSLGKTGGKILTAQIALLKSQHKPPVRFKADMSQEVRHE